MVSLNYVLIKLLGFFFLSKRILTNDTDLLWTRKFQCMLLSIKFLCSYDVSWPKYARHAIFFNSTHLPPLKAKFCCYCLHICKALQALFSKRFTAFKGTATRAFQSLLIVCQTFLAPEQSIYFTFSYQFFYFKKLGEILKNRYWYRTKP